MLGNRVFRVFVSSTFRDLKAERDALQEKVFPQLRAHCAAKGYGFQAVDLRWGIGEEASAGQRTMRICLSEVARCQELSPRPNFVVLLGDRYGWRPLPEVVGAAELEALAALLAPADLAAAEAAYSRDDNAVPPQYVLRPRGNGETSYDADALRGALAEAARRAGLPGTAAARYTLSATEQEIVKGAFEAGHADEHVFCFLRDLHGLPDQVPPLPRDPDLWPAAARYRDFRTDGTRDDEAGAMLADLKSRLRQRLGGNVFGYQAEWADAAASTGHIDQLCRDMLAALTRIIDAEIERLGAYSHLDAERAAHDAFASEHTDGFTGRIGYLDAIDRYLDGGENHPLCVFAAGGLGKSALMARAAADAAETHAGTVIVTRFIGVTPTSADPRSLLQDLCAEIGEAYGSAGPVPATLEELQRELPRRLELASAGQPLILFLDSLDQLAGGEHASLAWLPSDLPANVRLVTTTRPGPFLDALASRLPGNLVMELGTMPPDEGEILLNTWLAKNGRALTAGQRREVLSRFEACGSPLYLRLAFEEARLWPSALQQVRIGDDEPSIIAILYDRLEAEHGAELVGHALGFLACTYERLGLSEDELLDALTADERTWTEFTVGAAWGLPVRRLPVVVWSRLYFDLAPYLSPRVSEGASLLSFFHQELADVAFDRYVRGRAQQMHGVLADVMRALARGKDAGAREWKGGAHPLAELPYHQTRAGRWDDLLATLTDFTYLEAKASRVAVVTSPGTGGGNVSVYNGVRALMDDYDRATRSLPDQAGPETGSPTTARADQRLVLEAFRKVLGQEAHNLTQRPDLLWQQMYNRLQWADGPQKGRVNTGVLAPEFEERSKPGAGPWLRSLTRLRESEALIRTFTGHAGDVNAVAYSPDGTRIVSGSDDKTLKVWDASSGAELATLAGHAGDVNAVAYSPDGTRIVSGSCDATLKMWDAAASTVLATLTGHTFWVNAVAYSPDGTRIVSGSSTSMLTDSWDNSLKIWDAASGAELASLTGHTGWVHAVAYSPDGTRFVSGSGDRTIKVWDASSGAELATLTGHAGGVNAVAYSPDGTRIVSGSWGTIKIWDAASGVQLATPSGHTGGVIAVAYSPDGTRIVSGSWDRTAKIWDASSGAELATLSGHRNYVFAVAYSRDGTRIVTRDGGTLATRTVKVWDAASGAELTIPSDRLQLVGPVYSPDGTRIVSGSGTSADKAVKVQDAASHAELASLAGHAEWVRGAAYSPDGTRIVSGSEDRTLKIWDASSGAELATLTGHTGAVCAVAYSPDGTRIVSGSNDKTLRLWDAQTMRCIAILPCLGAVGTCDYSPQGTRICCGDTSGTVSILELVRSTSSIAGLKQSGSSHRSWWRWRKGAPTSQVSI